MKYNFLFISSFQESLNITEDFFSILMTRGEDDGSNGNKASATYVPALSSGFKK